MPQYITKPKTPTHSIERGYCECGCGQKTRVHTKTNTHNNHVKGEPARFVRGHSLRAFGTRITSYSSLENAFWHHANNPGTPDECWEWRSSTLGDYGHFGFRHKHYLAHRVSYEIHKGAIPDGKKVCHSCDNPSCWNPAHLWLGTQQENVADMMKKGRHSNKKRVPNHL